MICIYWTCIALLVEFKSALSSILRLADASETSSLSISFKASTYSGLLTYYFCLTVQSAIVDFESSTTSMEDPPPIDKKCKIKKLLIFFYESNLKSHKIINNFWFIIAGSKKKIQNTIAAFLDNCLDRRETPPLPSAFEYCHYGCFLYTI